MIALKLGGSVITEKDQDRTVDDAALETAAQAIAASDKPMFLVHGGGSFGHPVAQRHGLSPTIGTRDATVVHEVQTVMRQLNDAVVTRLSEFGAAPVGIHPFSVAARDKSGTLTLPTTQIQILLDEGFLPVLHGDIVAHAGKGATILSGDELVVHLANTLPAERIGLCSTVPGVLDAEGTVISEVDALTDVQSIVGESDDPDVTGGMAGKIEALITGAVPATIFGLHDLEAFLAGESVGTLVK